MLDVFSLLSQFVLLCIGLIAAISVGGLVAVVFVVILRGVVDFIKNEEDERVS